MLPQLQGKTAKAVITEMAEHLVAQGYAGDAPALIQLALERETVVSTAVENGLAFPHVRDIEDGGLTFALGLKPAGVPWEAPDGRRTRIIFFLLIPPPARAFYLRLLAGLVTVFGQEDPKESLLKCDTADAMWKVLLKTTMKSIP